MDEEQHLFGYRDFDFCLSGSLHEEKKLALFSKDRMLPDNIARFYGSSSDALIYQILGFDEQPSVEDARRAFKERILNLKTRGWKDARKRLGEYLDWESFQFTYGFKDATKINGLLPVGDTQISVTGGFDVTFTRNPDCAFIQVREGLRGEPVLKVWVDEGYLEGVFYETPAKDDSIGHFFVEHGEDVKLECRLLPDESYEPQEDALDEKSRENRYYMTVLSLFLISVSEGITFGSIPEIRVWLRFDEAGDVDNPESMIQSHFARFERETVANQLVILKEGMPHKLLRKEDLDRLADFLVSRVTDVELRAHLVRDVWYLSDSLKDDRAKAALVSLFNKPLDPWKSLLEKHLGTSFKPQISRLNYDIEVLMAELDPDWNPIKFWTEQGGANWEDDDDRNIGDFFLVELANAGDPAAARTVYDSYFKDEERFKDIISDNYDLFHHIFYIEQLSKYVEALVSKNDWIAASRVIASQEMSSNFDEEAIEKWPENRAFLEYCQKNADIIFDSLLKSENRAIKDLKELFYLISPSSRRQFEKIIYYFINARDEKIFEGRDAESILHFLLESSFRYVPLDAAFMRDAQAYWEEKDPAIKAILDKRMTSNYTKFKINEYLSVIKENTSVLILVDDVVFPYCNELVITISEQELEDRGVYLGDIKSIDQLTLEYSDHLGENAYVTKKGMISAEDEFWAQCSVLQAWDENEYDTRLLHSNNAFPLLKWLNKCGDPKALVAYKREIISRFLEGTISYKLIEENYINDVDDAEMHTQLVEEFNSYNAGHCLYLYKEFESEKISSRFPKCLDFIRNSSNLKARSGGFELTARELGFFIERQGINAFDEASLVKYMVRAIRDDYGFRQSAKIVKRTGKRILFTPTKSGYDLLIDFSLNHKLDVDFIKQEIEIWLGDTNRYGYGSLEELIYWVKDESFIALRDYLLDIIIKNIRESLPGLDSVPFLRPSSAFTVDTDKVARPHRMILDGVRNRAILCYEDGSLTAWNIGSHEKELAIMAPFKGDCNLLLSADADYLVILPHSLDYPIMKISLVTGKIIKRVEGQKPVEIPSPPMGVVLTAEQRDRYLNQLFKAEKEYVPPFRYWHARSPRDNKLICITEGNKLNLYNDALDCIFTKVIDLSINSLVLIGQDRIIYPIFPKDDNFAFSDVLYTSTLHTIGESGTSTSGKLTEKISKGDEPVVTQQGQYIIWPRWGRVVQIYDIKGNTISSMTHDFRTCSSHDYAISSDDKWLFQTGMIGIIWNMQTKAIGYLLLDTDMEFTKAAFFAEDDYLVTLSIAKTIKVWELPPGSNQKE